MKEIIIRRFEQHVEVVQRAVEDMADRIVAAVDMIVESCRSGGELFVFGNGGSAADAQHIAGELVGRYLKERPAIRARALSADVSIITSVANDYSYDQIFTRQLEAVAEKGDVALALSTSGNSPNVVNALEYCRSRGIATLAVTGAGGGRCAAVADILLDVPSDRTPCVQETTVVIYHTVCELVEEALSP